MGVVEYGPGRGVSKTRGGNLVIEALRALEYDSFWDHSEAHMLKKKKAVHTSFMLTVLRKKKKKAFFSHLK